jgi:hypothetical protein
MSGEVGDVKSILVLRGYRFGIDNHNGRVNVRLPENPLILTLFAQAVSMYKYPVRKRSFKP